MEFGHFFTMAVNADLGERVMSFPHRDTKNIAVGLCALFIFGLCFQRYVLQAVGLTSL